MGVPRHAFLAFMNNSVMGSMFTRYKSPALVNLDWATTFTPELLRKDLDLGLALGREWDVPMPVTAASMVPMPWSAIETVTLPFASLEIPIVTVPPSCE